MKQKLQSKISLTFFLFNVLTSVITGLILLSLFNILLNKEFGITLIDISSDYVKFDGTVIIYIFISVIIAVIFSSTLGYRYIKRLLMPISNLRNITKKFIKEHISSEEQSISIQNDDEIDEISELTGYFNLINEKLDSAVEEIQDKNTNMNAVLKSMQNGVIALDQKRKISMINPYAEKMFGVRQDKLIGKSVKSLVISEDVFEKIDKLSIGNPNVSFESEIKFPNSLICSFNCSIMTAANDPLKFYGVVIIIQDVTEIRKLENMRRDFVANVSHELKTPLTSIKGFVETLKDGGVEDSKIRNKFLDIINIETDRLFYLIQDILALSEIENKKNLKELQTIDIVKVIDDAIELLSEHAIKKDIDIKFYKNSDKVISGDEKWFVQMIINLLDNALKYTPEKGLVEINLYEEMDNIIIKIRDTGFGIPKEDLARIFERFYRVDKARTREIGGTGLGLAIVKHIILSLGGSIEVESELGKGTEFTINLPIV